MRHGIVHQTLRLDPCRWYCFDSPRYDVRIAAAATGMGLGHTRALATRAVSRLRNGSKAGNRMNESDGVSRLLGHWHSIAAKRLIRTARTLEEATQRGVDTRRLEKRLAQDARALVTIVDAESGLKKISKSLDEVEKLVRIHGTPGELAEMTDRYVADPHEIASN